VLAVTVFFLAEEWVPLGPQNSLLTNYLFVIVLLALILAVLLAVVRYYKPILNWCLVDKGKFLLVPLCTVSFGLMIWIGFPKMFGFVARGLDNLGWNVRTTTIWSGLAHTFPGTGKEIMPSLDEGSFLLMPTSMPHAGIEENKRVVQQLDMDVARIPEVDMAVGKLGRAESALDPAPIAMYENIINYKPEYSTGEKGRRQTYKTDNEGKFVLKSGDTLTND